MVSEKLEVEMKLWLLWGKLQGMDIMEYILDQNEVLKNLKIENIMTG